MTTNLPQNSPTVKNDTQKTLNSNLPTNGQTPAVFDGSTKGIIKAILDSGYNLRFNQIKGCIEVNGLPIDDFAECCIINALYDMGHKSAQRVRAVMAQAAYEAAYNPLLDYLGSLRWDGQDHIARLAGHFTGSDPYITYQDRTTRTAIHAFLRRWLIGVICKAMKGQQNTCLVFVGPQGIGKSFLARWLVENVKQLESLYIESQFNPDNEDNKRALPVKLVWELGELPSVTNRSDVNALKQILTQGTATVRTPYDRYQKDRRILASFFGTVNDDGAGFLHDKTGNRRFACVKVAAIDRAYSKEIAQDDVWAQVYALYMAGETGFLSPEEELAQDELGKEYLRADEFEDNLDSLFVVTGNLKDSMSGDLIAGIIVHDGWAKTKDEASKRAAPWLRRQGCKKQGVMKTWRGIRPRTTQDANSQMDPSS